MNHTEFLMLLSFLCGLGLGWNFYHHTYGRIQRRNFYRLLELQERLLKLQADKIIKEAKATINRLEDN